MGINGGGYTFIPREMISALSADDVGQIFKNQSNVLLRISRPDGSQPYTVVTSLINKPLTVLSSAHENDKPVNIDTIGAPYVYLNTLSSEDMKDIEERKEELYKINTVCIRLNAVKNSDF